MMQDFRNKHFTKRDYESTNIVACMAESAPDENWTPANEPQVLNGLTYLWTEAGVQYLASPSATPNALNTGLRVPMMSAYRQKKADELAIFFNPQSIVELAIDTRKAQWGWA